LKAIYEPKSKVSKQVLWDNFYGIKKSSNETVNQSVACIVLAAQKLRNASVKCDKEQVITRIFYVLLDDYLAVEQHWEGLESSRRIIAILMAKLNAHEERLNRRTATTETTAYKTQVTAPATNNNGDKKKKKKKKNDDWKKKVKCFGCRKKGHIACDCSHKKDDGQDGGNKKDEAYCSFVDASVTVDSWIIDSGASYHMTPRREWFVDYEPYVVSVNMANGNKVPSAGRGTILIKALVEGGTTFVWSTYFTSRYLIEICFRLRKS